MLVLLLICCLVVVVLLLLFIIHHCGSITCEPTRRCVYRDDSLTSGCRTLLSYRVCLHPLLLLLALSAASLLRKPARTAPPAPLRSPPFAPARHLHGSCQQAPPCTPLATLCAARSAAALERRRRPAAARCRHQPTGCRTWRGASGPAKAANICGMILIVGYNPI